MQYRERDQSCERESDERRLATGLVVDDEKKHQRDGRHYGQDRPDRTPGTGERRQ
jgi:hypothetical protein